MQVISINFVPVGEAVRASAPYAASGERRSVRRTSDKDKPTAATSPSNSEIASRPFNEAIYKSLMEVGDETPVAFDPAVGVEWQKGLR